MLLTLIVIFLLLVGVVGGYLMWSWHAQRDQEPGRHRTAPSSTRPSNDTQGRHSNQRAA